MAMTAEQFLESCKIGMGMSSELNEAIDPILRQKILAARMFMKGAGISDEKIESDLGMGILVMGVMDLWELKSGEVKFSPAFFTLTTQLAMGRSYEA